MGRDGFERWELLWGGLGGLIVGKRESGLKMSMVWKMFLENGVAWGLGDGEGRV